MGRYIPGTVLYRMGQDYVFGDGLSGSMPGRVVSELNQKVKRSAAGFVSDAGIASFFREGGDGSFSDPLGGLYGYKDSDQVLYNLMLAGFGNPDRIKVEGRSILMYIKHPDVPEMANGLRFKFTKKTGPDNERSVRAWADDIIRRAKEERADKLRALQQAAKAAKTPKKSSSASKRAQALARARARARATPQVVYSNLRPEERNVQRAQDAYNKAVLEHSRAAPKQGSLALVKLAMAKRNLQNAQILLAEAIAKEKSDDTVLGEALAKVKFAQADVTKAKTEHAQAAPERKALTKANLDAAWRNFEAAMKVLADAIATEKANDKVGVAVETIAAVNEQLASEGEPSVTNEEAAVLLQSEPVVMPDEIAPSLLPAPAAASGGSGLFLLGAAAVVGIILLTRR